MAEYAPGCIIIKIIILRSSRHCGTNARMRTQLCMWRTNVVLLQGWTCRLGAERDADNLCALLAGTDELQRLASCEKPAVGCPPLHNRRAAEAAAAANAGSSAELRPPAKCCVAWRETSRVRGRRCVPRKLSAGAALLRPREVGDRQCSAGGAGEPRERGQRSGLRPRAFARRRPLSARTAAGRIRRIAPSCAGAAAGSAVAASARSAARTAQGAPERGKPAVLRYCSFRCAVTLLHPQCCTVSSQFVRNN